MCQGSGGLCHGNETGTVRCRHATAAIDALNVNAGKVRAGTSQIRTVISYNHARVSFEPFFVKKRIWMISGTEIHFMLEMSLNVRVLIFSYSHHILPFLHGSKE